jgi:hypothetical protein
MQELKKVHRRLWIWREDEYARKKKQPKLVIPAYERCWLEN